MSIPVWSTPTGSLGTVEENTHIVYFLSYVMTPNGNLSFLSGELPNGLTLDTFYGTISGKPSNINTTKDFNFTLRLSNEDGISDRNFSIKITSSYPYWISNSIILENIPPLEVYREERFFETFFEINDPGATSITYDLISGQIPNRLTLEPTGRLSGFITKEAGTYDFRLRATGSVVIEKDFQLVILDGSDNRPPFWSSLPGWIGNLEGNVPFSFDLSGGDSDADSLTFTLHPDDTLPNGLTLNSDGLISGTYVSDAVANFLFRVIISDTHREVIRRFLIRANFTLLDQDIYIIQPPNTTLPANLGTLEIDEDSYFNIQAVSSTAKWIRFELSSGSMPQGLSINLVNGNIEGTVASNCPAGVYVFTIRAYNNFLLEDTMDFSITISPRPIFRKDRVSTIVTGHDRVKFNEFFYNYNIIYNKIFRPDDKNFGITLTNELIIKKYANVEPNNLYNSLEKRIRSVLTPTRFITTPVVNSRMGVICDAVVCLFSDSKQESLSTFVQPQTGLTVKNASVQTIRGILETEFSSPANAFEKWDSNYYETNLNKDSFTVKDHDLYLGKEVMFKNQDIPSPFLNDVIYYAIPLNKNEFRLANTLAGAANNSYVRFNINDIDRPGLLYTYHLAIPIVYAKKGEGQAIVEKLNKEFSTRFYKLDSIELVNAGVLNEEDGEFIVPIIANVNTIEDATIKIKVVDQVITKVDIVNPGKYTSEPTNPIGLNNISIDTEFPQLNATWVKNPVIFDDINVYLRYLVYGDTQTTQQENLVMLWFDPVFTYPNGA